MGDIQKKSKPDKSMMFYRNEQFFNKAPELMLDFRSTFIFFLLGFSKPF